jgi:hypothetical protein
MLSTTRTFASGSPCVRAPSERQRLRDRCRSRRVAHCTSPRGLPPPRGSTSEPHAPAESKAQTDPIRARTTQTRPRRRRPHVCIWGECSRLAFARSGCPVRSIATAGSRIATTAASSESGSPSTSRLGFRRSVRNQKGGPWTAPAAGVVELRGR